jgi:predicted nucleotidyltransferase
MKRITGDSELPADLDCLVSRIVEAAHPLRVILFGSRARGEAHPDSDADLLIVQSEADAVHRSRWCELQRIRAAVRDVPLAKDIVLYRPVTTLVQLC